MKLKRKDLIYPKLCYNIIGILFEVYNELGSGYQEKYYQRAIAVAFRENNISFEKEVFISLRYRGSKIGRYFLDFLVEDKIVLEIKKGNYFSKGNINQIYAYLQATDVRLGILANFTSTGIKFKRIVNIDNS